MEKAQVPVPVRVAAPAQSPRVAPLRSPLSVPVQSPLLNFAPAPFFEGTEKRIEVDFDGDGDLRTVVRAGWEEVVRLSATQILHHKVTPEFTSFLLSESSLIVYPQKVVLKTCGNTVPICSVHKICELARSVNLEPEWFCYSRKNFLDPTLQPPDHKDKDIEIELCRTVCNGIGDAFVLGPLTGDHWLIYDATFIHVDCSKRSDYQVDIMMYDLPKDVQASFHTKEPEGSLKGAADMTKAAGLIDICAFVGGEIDDYNFSPFGYSCNIHIGDCNAMVHVTPQDGCSYASFETNVGSSRDGPPDKDAAIKLNAIVGKVLDAFRPKRLTVTLFIDGGAQALVGKAPFEAADSRYERRTCTCTSFAQDYHAQIVHYETKGPLLVLKRKRSESEVEPQGKAAKDHN